MCPEDRMPMYEVRYGDSSIYVDVCNVCRGVWLDRGEFKDIIGYLREVADEKILNHYLHTVSEELWEVFSGPEILREELLDLIAVVKLIQEPAFAQAMTVSARARVVENFSVKRMAKDVEGLYESRD